MRPKVSKLVCVALKWVLSYWLFGPADHRVKEAGVFLVYALTNRGVLILLLQ